MARTAKTLRLTALEVKRYADDASATSPLHDGGGLYLRKRGLALLWYLRSTDPASGAQQWHRLFPDDPQGVYPHKSLGDARTEARKLWALRSEGLDPRAERRKRIELHKQAEAEARLSTERRITVRALFQRWALTDLTPRIGTDGRRIGRKDGGAFTKAQFERRVFPRLGAVPADSITRSDLLEVLDSAKGEGKLRTANVLLTDLKQMFRFALTRDIVARNPLDTVTKRDVGGAPVERDRVLSADELRTLALAIHRSGLDARYVAAVWLILSTGARMGELLGAVWSDSKRLLADLRATALERDVKLGVVDFVKRTWSLSETKNQRDHVIHLSRFALAQFRCLERLRTPDPDRPNEQSAWVFASLAGNGPVGVKTLGKQLSDRQREPDRQLARRTKATDSLSLPGGRWTAHDLRRTAATLMAELGISGDVIDECLNHMIESRVRRTYIRNRRTVEQVEAFDALGAHLEGLLHPKRRRVRQSKEVGTRTSSRPTRLESSAQPQRRVGGTRPSAGRSKVTAAAERLRTR